MTHAADQRTNQNRVGADYPFEHERLDYRTGRFLARVISFCVWLVIIVAVALAVFAIGLGSYRSNVGVAAFGFGIGGAIIVLLSGLITGILLVASGHMMRVTMDTANAIRQMLSTMQR